MKVILIESTNNVGMVGDVVNVKAGFARNYLLPQKKAVVADEFNLKVFAHQKRMLEKKILKARDAAKTVKEKIDGQEVTLIRKTAKANKLFGSVTSLDIQKAVEEQLDMQINRKGIVLADPIKQTGTFPITIKLDGGVQASLSVIVEQDLTAPAVEVPDLPRLPDLPEEEKAPVAADPESETQTQPAQDTNA